MHGYTGLPTSLDNAWVHGAANKSRQSLIRLRVKTTDLSSEPLDQVLLKDHIQLQIGIIPAHFPIGALAAGGMCDTLGKIRFLPR